MNIFGNARRALGLEYLFAQQQPTPQKNAKSEQKEPAQEPKDQVEISPSDDGPGAGGGYDGDEVPEVAPSDGPGAGGGYDGDEAPRVAPSDGPGAGGGYDGRSLHRIFIEDSDGPGAGGGYDGADADSDGPGAGGGYDDREVGPLGHFFHRAGEVWGSGLRAAEYFLVGENSPVTEPLPTPQDQASTEKPEAEKKGE